MNFTWNELSTRFSVITWLIVQSHSHKYTCKIEKKRSHPTHPCFQIHNTINPITMLHIINYIKNSPSNLGHPFFLSHSRLFAFIWQNYNVNLQAMILYIHKHKIHIYYIGWLLSFIDVYDILSRIKIRSGEFFSSSYILELHTKAVEKKSCLMVINIYYFGIVAVKNHTHTYISIVLHLLCRMSSILHRNCAFFTVDCGSECVCIMRTGSN